MNIQFNPQFSKLGEILVHDQKLNETQVLLKTYSVRFSLKNSEF